MYRDSCTRLAVFVAGASLVASAASASTFKLTNADFSARARINGALLEQSDFVADSTHVVDPILSIGKSATGRAAGFNTNGVRLDEVPLVTIEGVAYRQFLLDVDEPVRGARPISLNAMRISLGGASTLSSLKATTQVYSLRGRKDPTHIRLNGNLTGGLGRGDLMIDIPDVQFSSVENAGNLPYVYLDASFTHVRGGAEQFSLVHDEGAGDPQSSSGAGSSDVPTDPNPTSDDPTKNPPSMDDGSASDPCGCTCHDQDGDTSNPSVPEPGSAFLLISLGGAALLRRRQRD